MTTATALAVAGELSIYRAAELKPVLLAAVEAAGAGGALEVDLADVTEIDTAGVQLLLLSRREATAGGVALRLGAPSAPVRDAFDLLDLGGHLDGA